MNKEKHTKDRGMTIGEAIKPIMDAIPEELAPKIKKKLSDDNDMMAFMGGIASIVEDTWRTKGISRDERMANTIQALTVMVIASCARWGITDV